MGGLGRKNLDFCSKFLFWIFCENSEFLFQILNFNFYKKYGIFCSKFNFGSEFRICSNEKFVQKRNFCAN